MANAILISEGRAFDVDDNERVSDTVLAAHRAGREVRWRQENIAGWSHWPLSTDAGSGITDTTLFVVDGIAWGHGVNGSASTSTRRDWWLIPGTEGWADSEMYGLWWGGPTITGAGQPQHGFVHRAQLGADGKRRGATVWHDTAFGIASIQNVGVWSATTDGNPANFTANGSSTDLGARTVTSGSRTTNVVTLTVGANHRLEVGQLVTVGVQDSSYNGRFPIETVSATQITYRQVVADDASSGTGTVSPYDLSFGGPTNNLFVDIASSAAARTSNIVTATVPADHPFKIGDRLQADYTDNVYDGTFVVHAVTDTTIKWVQVAADDVSAGTGTLTKILPYSMRSRLIGNTLEIAWRPYQGFDDITAVLTGEPAFGDPQWSYAADISALTPPVGVGSCAIEVGHIGSTSPFRVGYGPIVCKRLD